MDRQELINRFQKWLDTNPRKQIIAAQCATIAIDYHNEQLLLLGVGCSKPNKEDFIFNVSDQHVYIEQMNKGRLQDIDRYLNLTQTVEDKTIG